MPSSIRSPHPAQVDDPVRRGQSAPALAAAADSEAALLAERVAEIPFWWHSVPLPHGMVTPGSKQLPILQHEWSAMQVPSLAGKSVLDIGAWDGFFSFAAEGFGAERVVSLDHYMWSVDMAEWLRYRQDCLASGACIEPCETLPALWKPETLPGRAGYDLAHEALGSRAEPFVGDFMTMDLAAIGQFDVVFYLGVLYHIKDPFLAIRRLAEVTREVAIIETEAVVVPGLEDRSICEFFEADEHAADPSNWWAPSRRALEGMCRAAGFREARTITAPSATQLSPGQIGHYRLHVQAWK